MTTTTPPVPRAPRFLVLDEVAEQLRVCRSTVKKLVRTGALRIVRVAPNCVRVPEGEVARFVAERMEAPPSAPDPTSDPTLESPTQEHPR